MKFLQLVLFVHLFYHLQRHICYCSKIRKLIDFLDKDGPDEIKKIPNYNEESIGFKRNKKFDACRENPKICSNGGKCIPKDGNFYCLCPLTHYGKVCEHIADQKNCGGNFCQNNSTCVSIPVERRIVNTVLLEQFRAKKPPNEKLSDTELSWINIVVAYECICRPEFFGVLCDVTEKTRECEEDYCLGRGKGKIVNKTCSCECEKQYFGERCEQISVCFETECQNGGYCENVVNKKEKTINAKCNCPQTIEFIDAKVSGEVCEKLEISKNINKSWIPCEKDGNSYDFYTQLIRSIDMDYFEDSEALENLRDSYYNSENSTKKLDSGWCENEGKCVPEFIKLNSNRTYYISRCDCVDPLTEGNFCEFKRDNFCSLTRQEMEDGMNIDEKCTGITHGKCIEKNGKPSCLCNEDYVGEKCEYFDPCFRKPCSNGDCIPLSNFQDLPPSEAKYQCLCPLSAKLQNETECITINEGKCRSGMCGNGRCVPCERQDDFDFMPLCSEIEQKRGFRCICEAGFIPPFCRVHSNSCWENLCENNSTCKENNKKSYDCICINGTSGTLCENIDDACEAFGRKTCLNGKCIDDIYYRRGFSCQCDDGFEGLNCEIELSGMTTAYRKFTKYYQFSVPLAVCLPTFSIVILLMVLV